MKARHLSVVLVLALLLPLGVAAGLFLAVVVTRPPQGDRIEAPHGVVGIRSGESYVWIVPSEQGVVLVDAGSDASAAAVREAIGDRPVLGILLTHGHADHLLGLEAFPGVPVHHGPGAGPIVRGEALPGSFLGDLAARQVPWPELPPLHPVEDEAVVAFDTLRFRAFQVAGHSPGSTAWQWRDGVFVGDAVMATSPPRLPPDLFTSDPLQAKASATRLLRLDVGWLADGHVGVLHSPRPALAELLGVPLDAPNLTLEDADGGDVVAVEGRYVQWPMPDARGRRPARLRADDGTWWGLSAAPVPAHAGWWQRRVRVEGRAVVGSRADALGGPGLEALRIEALDDGPAGVRRVLPDDLTAWQGAWVEVVLPLERLAPLDAGAAMAEGAAGGWGLTAPVAAVPWVGRSVTWLAQVDGPALRAVAACEGDVPGCGISADAPAASDAPAPPPAPGTPPAAGRR